MRRIVRHRPSPALVIALIALFFAVGGSAYGLVVTGRTIKNGTVRGADIKNGSLAARDIKKNSLGGSTVRESALGTVPTAGSASSAGVANGSAHQAVVTSAGVLARGRGVSSVSRTGTGRYQVIFDTNVRGCTYTGNVGDAGAATPPEGIVTVGQLASNVNGVNLKTLNEENGAPENRPFHLLVSC